MSNDPLASLRIWGAEVVIGDDTYRFGKHSASDWLLALLETEDGLGGLVNLLEEGEEGRLDEAILAGRLTDVEILQGFKQALTEVCGRPWWQAMKLLGLLLADWHAVFGIIRGSVDPDKVSLAAFLDVGFAALLRDREKQILVNHLETPPPGVEVELDEEKSEQVFLSMLNQTKQPAR